MLHSNYNLLTLKGLSPSKTYFDKLPKDLVWYLLGYTGPKEGYVVIRQHPLHYNKTSEIVKATTVHNLQELKDYYYEPYQYNTRYKYAKVKFIFIDGKQYAAVPINKKIEGFTPKKTKEKIQRCQGETVNGKRCRHKTKNKQGLCYLHR
jgi:hypothetical protein